MKPTDSDPYTSPSAGLETGVTDNKNMQKLPRISTWHVFALNILTLGLYYPYWLYTRSMIINQVHTNKIPSNLINTVLAILIINLLFSLVSGQQTAPDEEKAASSLLSLLYIVSSWYWAFTIRNRIHQMTHAVKHSGYWLNGILTLLFPLLYLQYKINEYIDTHQAESSLAS